MRTFGSTMPTRSMRSSSQRESRLHGTSAINPMVAGTLMLRTATDTASALARSWIPRQGLSGGLCAHVMRTRYGAVVAESADGALSEDIAPGRVRRLEHT